jgi:hypothetical protein
MKAMSLSARARRDGLDLDELYPTDRNSAGSVAKWIERGDDPPVSVKSQRVHTHTLERNTSSAWQRAWLATQALLFCVGAVALVAAMAALPPLVIVAGTVALGVAWFALYHLISSIEARSK